VKPEISIVTSEPYKDPNAMLCAVGPERFPEAFRARLAAAEPAETPDNSGSTEPTDLADALPYDAATVADAFLSSAPASPIFTGANAAVSEDQTLRGRWLFHRSRAHLFCGRCYVEIPPDELRARIAAFIRRRSWLGRKGHVGPMTPTSQFVSNTVLNLQAEATIPSWSDPPLWADGRPAVRWLVLHNGLLDVDRLLKVYREIGGNQQLSACLAAHTEELFTTIALPFDFRPDAECPGWHTFLDRVLPEPDLQQIIREWFGYCLLPTQAYQRILILQGDGANGKSVLAAVLKGLVGARNCSAVPLETLHLPHALEPMVGSVLNLATEWAHIAPAGLNVLKAVSGGDAVTINPKNRAAYECVLPTRFLVATNDVPAVSDRTDAIWRRLMIIPFNVRIPEAERKPLRALVSELCGELPGILNWALGGLATLTERGGFGESPVMLQIKGEAREDSNPAAAWCAENLSEGSATEELMAGEAYGAYAAWCKTSGHKAMGDRRFGREIARWWRMRHPGQEIPKVRVKQSDGRRVWAYSGVAMAVGAYQLKEQRGWWNS